MHNRNSDPSGANPDVYDLRFIWLSALRHRKTLFVAHGLALFATLCSVPVPLLMPLLVDEVLLGQAGPTVSLIDRITPPEWRSPVLYISMVLGITLLLRLAGMVLNVLQTRQFTLIAKDLTLHIRAALIHRLQTVSMAEYETLGGGQIISHLVTDVDTVDQFIGVTVSKLLIAVLSLTGTAAVLVWMNWQLALFILIVNPLVIGCTRLVGQRVKRLKRRENEAVEAFQRGLSDTLEGIQQIRAANREAHYFQRLLQLAEGVRKHAAAYTWKSDAASRSSFLIFLYGFDLFRAVAMLMVLYSGLSIGQMLAVFGYLWFMMAPVQELLNIQYALFSARAALGRINRITALRREPSYPHQSNPFRGSRTVSIRTTDLHFRYGQNEEVLKGVTIDIRAGEKIALVGASGGGKSTLVQVLIGMYPPSSGMVYYDDVPLDRIGLDVVREHVATVLQHPILFNDTVRANLTLGRDLPDSRLWEALRTAQLDSLILGYPANLHTLVGRQGLRLSGGQRQRLAIARMILQDPQVVILDEATSALDMETEHALHSALTTFLAGRTTIVVAHRLSAVRQADRIYVFEDGRICEQGRHDELLQRDGMYRRLYGERKVVHG